MNMYIAGRNDGIMSVIKDINSIIVNGDLLEKHWEWWRDELRSLIKASYVYTEEVVKNDSAPKDCSDVDIKPDRFDVIQSKLQDLCNRVKDLEKK